MAEEISKPEQQIYDTAAREHISYEEACRQVIDGMTAAGIPEEAIVPVYEKALLSIQEREVANAKGEFDEAATSKEDYHHWYDTAKPDTAAWRHLREKLTEKIGEDGTSTIHQESGKVVGLLADPATKKLTHKGLVVGYVQSGKTANFSAVITKAVDEGYRFVIVLAGMYNNLRRQTQERLNSDVVAPIRSAGKPVYALTSIEGDISSDADYLLNALRTNSSVVFAVVKKNYSRLGNLLKQLEAANREGLLEDVPMLIIDDESDQATPNTAKEDEAYSGINRLLRQIWDQVQQGSYVAYTATPFANVLMDPNDEERYTEYVESDNPENPEGETIERYPGLYPSDFIYALERPDGYIGASRIFGTPLWATEDEDGALNDGVDLDAVRDIPTGEADDLCPPARKDTRDGKKKYEPKMVDSLEAAVQWFMIATALRRRRAKKKQHSSMLIHLSHIVDTHFETVKVIEDYLDELKRGYDNPEINKLMQGLYEREVARMQAVRPEEVYPEWDSLKIAVGQVIRETKCIVDNGSSEERLEYKENEPATYIVIGGNTLARGLTLEGLICSYYLRASKTYDALLQMGRWFGFRPGYDDLIRLWTTADLQDYYRHLAGVEDEIREEIRLVGSTPKSVGVKIRTHPGVLQVTAANKKRHAKALTVDYSGKLHQLTRFEEKNTEILNHNIQVFESLIGSISSTHEVVQDKNNGSYLFREVPVDVVLSYFKDFKAHSSHYEAGADKLVEWIEKYADQDWNVVVYSGTQKDMPQQNFAGLDIRMVTRSAYNIPLGNNKSAEENKIADLGALAVGDTPILDFKILANAGNQEYKDLLEGLKEKEKKNTGESEKKRMGRAAQLNLRYVEGNVPLLVIYVVNPHSKAKPGARRRDLDAAAPVVLHAVVLPQVAGSDYSNFISVVPEQVEDLALDEEELDENSLILAAAESDDEGDYKE